MNDKLRIEKDNNIMFFLLLNLFINCSRQEPTGCKFEARTLQTVWLNRFIIFNSKLFKMFFKNYFNAVAESLDIKYKAYQMPEMNSADIGELCEIFLKEYLIDSLDEHYKIYRGGKIVNSAGNKSPQLDIILTNKNTIKIFGDKGIYPVETVLGVFSITSNLTKQKLIDSIKGLGQIPKHNYTFSIENFYGEDFKKRTHNVWKNIFPFSCIFAYKGDITDTWLETIQNEIKSIKDHSLWPAMIIVNKKGMFEKEISIDDSHILVNYKYYSLDSTERYGLCFSKILFDLYNMSSEQYYMKPDYKKYFEKDF